MTPLSILNGDVPCSQAQRTHSRTAIGWQSMELVSNLFDTRMYGGGRVTAVWAVLVNVRNLEF